MVFCSFAFLGCQQDDATKIIGLWKLLRFEVQDSSGNWEPYRWNDGGTGYLMYDGHGHVAIHISPKGYHRFQLPKEEASDSMSAAELRGVLDTLMLNYNYIARYAIDQDKKEITHLRISHSRPEDWGKTVVRKYQFVGPDTLLLFPVEGSKKRKLTWLRD